ncbi:MAG: hypothetical protein FJY80_04800, partial [Candidatus Aminicenantes bacterium]|nr:hypothetical protein [Candidatus Aminicenantes bacterium]
MLTRMSSKHAFIRRASALGLILSFLLLNGLYANPPWGGVVLRTDPAIQTKYDGLTLAELQREAYDLMKRVQDLSGRYHEEEMRLFFRENNELMLNDSDWKIEIMTKEAEIENQRNAQNQLSQEATRDWRGQLFPEDKLRMEAHEETIRKLRSEIGELQKRVNQGVRMREELAKRAAPELKAAKAQFKAETEQLMADRKTIAEVAERKFGRDVLWQAEPIARPSLPGPPQNPETIKATEVSRPPGDTLR